MSKNYIEKIPNKISELLSSPDRWTKGDRSVDSENSPVCVNDKRACRWCLLGAVELVYGNYGPHVKGVTGILKQIADRRELSGYVYSNEDKDELSCCLKKDKNGLSDCAHWMDDEDDLFSQSIVSYNDDPLRTFEEVRNLCLSLDI